MATLYLIRHAPVELDLDVPSSEWKLSIEGTHLAERLAALPIFRNVAAVYSSPEPKAVATAQPLARRFAVPIVEHPALVELRRGPTNIAGREAYEQTVREAFESPNISAHGWERAIDAQRRMIDVVQHLAGQHSAPFVVVSHGLALALLMAHLDGCATVDFGAWRAIPLPALAVVDTAAWQVLMPFTSVETLQQTSG